MAVAGEGVPALPERWPELARIKERLAAKEKPSALEEFYRAFEPLVGPAAELFTDQVRRMREIRQPLLVQTGPGEWRADGGFATNTANGLQQVNLAGVVPGAPLSVPTGSLVPDPYGGIPPEDKELMEHCLAELEPDILKQTQELIKTEIRDSMVLGGNWVRLKELLKSGAKPRVIRKRQGGRDPLFLVFGDGVETEIEEVRVLG